jgi:hypothetical protein
MSPCEINALITALTNYLYVKLPEKEFLFWNIFFSELSKSMFSMELFRKVCKFEEKEKNEHKNDK